MSKVEKGIEEDMEESGGGEMHDGCFTLGISALLIKLDCFINQVNTRLKYLHPPSIVKLTTIGFFL